MTVAVESGLVGLALFAVLLVAVFVFGLGTIIRERESEDRAVVALFCAAVAGVALGISILSIPDELTFLFLAIGVFVAARGRLSMPRRTASPHPAAARDAALGPLASAAR